MERSAKQRTISVLSPGQPAAPGQAVTSNFPAYLTPLIGREQEVQVVCSLRLQMQGRDRASSPYGV